MKQRIAPVVAFVKERIRLVRVFARVSLLESRTFPLGACEGCGGMFHVRHPAITYDPAREVIRCGVCEAIYRDDQVRQARAEAKRARRSARRVH